MISPRYNLKNKNQIGNPLKLPQIPFRKQIHSVKKYSTPLVDLPNIKKPTKKQLSIDKQNNSQNILKRKYSIEDQIKARLHEVQFAQKMVNNVLGGPQATLNLGGDMTNFQHKIEINRQLIRKHRNKTQLKQQNNNSDLHQSNVTNENSPKIKSISSKQVSLNQKANNLIMNEMKLNIQQNHETESNRNTKNSQKVKNEEENKVKFKSHRENSRQQISIQNGQKIFKSIKEILQDPQKAAQDHEDKRSKQVKFNIQQLQNKLKKMNNLQFSRSKQDNIDNQNNNVHRNLTAAKSVGMIPISNTPIFEQYTFKNWNKVEFLLPNRSINEQHTQCQRKQQKQVKHYKSDFQNQVDQIQKLEMKSYKSIEKMVENRKLLIDLQLIYAKNQSCVINKKQRERKATQSNL